MLEFSPQCRLGSPHKSSCVKAQELQNFSLLRDESDALIGFAISDGEVKDPVLCVTTDPLLRRFWLQTKDDLFFISHSDLPADAVQFVIAACQSMAPITIYSLPVQEGETHGSTP